MYWDFLYLNDLGQLCYIDGAEVNQTWPTFKSVMEADAWLEANDVRANCVGLVSEA